MKHFISILILILISCGKQELEPAKKTATASNDIDGDGLSATQEKELGSHEKIADIPNLAFKPSGNYRYQLSYNIDNKQKELNLDGSYGDSQSSEFSKSIAQIAFHPINEISPLSAQISLELEMLEIVSKLNIDRVRNLILDLYIEDQDQKLIILNDFKTHDYSLGEKITIENQKVNPQTLLQLIYHQKKIRIEVVDFEFDHPVLENKVEYLTLLENIKKLNSEIIFLNDYDLKLYSSEISINELMSYYSLSGENTSTTELQIATTYLMPSDQRVIERKQKREIGRIKTLKRSNGIPVSGNQSVRTSQKEVLIQINGKRNQFATTQVTYITPEIFGVGGRCRAQIRRIQSTSPISLTHSLLETFVATGSIHEVIPIDSNTWLIITDQTLDWRIPTLSSNQINIGDYNKTCAVYESFITNYEPLRKSYYETSLTLNISESSITNSSEQ